jgi:uncharacterized membrane protein
MAEESGCCVCFSNKTKARCASIVLYISIGLIVLGAFCAIYGYFGLDIKETWKIGDEEFPSPLTFFAIAVVIVGLFTLVTGVLGVLTAKCKNACFAVPFALFSFVLMLAMLIVAIIGILVSGAADNVRTNFCLGGFTVDGNTYLGL